jgi:hypothetical protein
MIRDICNYCIRKCFYIEKYDSIQINPTNILQDPPKDVIERISENNISNISSKLSKYFNREKSFESISEFGLLKKSIIQLNKLTYDEKENIKLYTEEEKIELIFIYDFILYCLLHENSSDKLLEIFEPVE